MRPLNKTKNAGTNRRFLRYTSMKGLKAMLLLLLLSGGLLHGQNDTISRIAILPFLRENPPQQPAVIYYNFYNGVQIIEVDFSGYHQAKVFTDPVSYARALPPQMILQQYDRTNTFYVRNKEGKILAKYGTGDFACELKPVGTTTTVAHSSRLKLHTVLSGESDINSAGKYLYKIFNDGWGIMDTLGHVKMQTKYDNIFLADSLYFVREKHQWGLYSLNFEPIIQPQYNHMLPIGKRRIIVSNSKWGVIDYTGKQLVPLKYDGLRKLNIEKDFFVYDMNGRLGLMDSLYNLISPAKYQELEPLGKRFYARYNNLYGILDDLGNATTPFKYAAVPELMDDGYYTARVTEPDGRGHVVMLDPYGREVSSQYDEITGLEPGIKRVQLSQKFGVINLEGNELTGNIYDELWSGANGYLVVKVGDLYGLIDSLGKEVVAITYQRIDQVSEDMVLALHGNKWGFINLKGHTNLPFIYENAKGFAEGVCPVMVDRKWGLINRKGKLLVSFIYDEMYDFKHGLALVQRNGKFGFINLKGKEVIPAIYDWSNHNWFALIPVKLNGKYGCINRKGKVVLPFEYDYGNYSSDGTLEMHKNGETLFYDEKGSLIDR